MLVNQEAVDKKLLEHNRTFERVSELICSQDDDPQSEKSAGNRKKNWYTVIFGLTYRKARFTTKTYNCALHTQWKWQVEALATQSGATWTI